MKATDTNALYFNIDYLQSNPADIQDNITKTVTAMRAGFTDDNAFPYVIGGIDENGVPYYGTLPKTLLTANF